MQAKRSHTVVASELVSGTIETLVLTRFLSYLMRTENISNMSSSFSWVST